MAASKKTTSEVLKIMLKYVPELDEFMDELLKVKGNASFKQTIKNIDESWESWKKRNRYL